MLKTPLLIAFDRRGSVIANVVGEFDSPKLSHPDAGISGVDVARLVVFAPHHHDQTIVEDKLLVFDFCGQSPLTSLTIEADANSIVTRVRFSGYLRVYLGVAGPVTVHGELNQVDGKLKWSSLHFHFPSVQVDFDVSQDIEGVTKQITSISSEIPCAKFLGLQTPTGLLPGRIEFEFAKAPIPGTSRYTGENLASQLTNDASKKFLVLRMRQKHRLALTDQYLESPQVQFPISSQFVSRARLNLWRSVNFVQTHGALNEDGQLGEKIGNWIIRLDSVPMLSGLHAYNASATRYLGALQTISDGRPISGLPVFDEREWDASVNFATNNPSGSDIEFRRRWWVAFDFHDTFAQALPFDRNSFLTQGSIDFRSATPQLREEEQDDLSKQYKYATSFGGLLRHDFYIHSAPQELGPPFEGALRMDCLIDHVDGVSGDSSLDSLARGFAFTFKRVLRGSAHMELPAKWVRIGALDLGFGAQLDGLPDQYFDGGFLIEEEAQKITDRKSEVSPILEQRQISVVTLNWRRSRGNWIKDAPLIARDRLLSGEKAIRFKNWNQVVPTVALEDLFIVKYAIPGGQDGLPDEPFHPVDYEDDETLLPDDDSATAVARRFVRENPIIISTDDLSERRGDGPFLLRIREHTSAMQSQALSMNLFELGGNRLSRTENKKLVVLDRHPFSVALVSAPPLIGITGADGNLEVGNWSASGFEGASWELAGASDGFTAYFPPQALGEGMEKLVGADVVENKPGQFRLSPVSTFELESSYFRQNFTEAVWNLRRILGYPGQRAPGAGIKALYFELLYGLGCEVRSEHLRLAELASRVGSIPDALPRRISNVLGSNDQNQPVDGLKMQQDVFDRLNYRWSRQFESYLSRLGIYEAWRNFREAQLTLQSKVQYVLRPPSRITQNPASPIEHDENDPQSALLAGGALWGFDFESQFKPFNDSAKTRRSTSGELSRPSFSALGGWGYQKAVFQDGLTTIYSDTAMGRTFFYSVERIGRIAGFWNFAKHVVIYERTVSTAKQFRPTRNNAGQITIENQDHLAGRPVLRKVREFVEILQPKRRYPDLGSGLVDRGCVQAIEFSTTVIPIDYRWGTDVFDAAGEPIGYVIPLWHPEADPAIYPKPQVSVRIAGAESSTESLACELLDPQKLVFYSQSDNTTGEKVDTDKWSGVRGVDYPDASWPTPQPLSTPSNQNLEAPLPDEVSVSPGYESFTYNIRAPKPANLVANRSDEITAAMLRNVSMVRANPFSKPVSQANAVAASAVVKAKEQLGKSRDSLNDLVSAVEGNLGSRTVQSQIVNLVGQLVGSVSNAGNELETAFTGANPSLLSKPRDWERLTLSSVKRWHRAADSVLSGEFEDRLKRKLNSLGSDLEKAKSDARRALQESWDVFRLVAPSIDPGIEEIRNRLNRSVERIGNLRETLRPVIDEEVGAIEKMLDYPLLDIVPTRDDAIAIRAHSLNLHRRFVRIVRDATNHAIDDLALHLRNNVLGPSRILASDADVRMAKWHKNVIQDLERPIDEILDDYRKAYDELDAWAATINGVLARSQEGIRQFSDALNEMLDLDVSGISIRDLVQSSKLIDDCLQQIANATSVNQLRNHANSLVQRITQSTQQLGAAGSAFFTSFLNRFDPATSLFQKLVKPWANAAELPDRLSDTISNLVPADIQQLFDDGDLVAAKRQLDQLLGDARTQLDSAIGNLTQPLAGRFPEGIIQEAGTTLRLVRAFGDSPLVQGMDFTRKRLGYFYDPLKAVKGLPIDISPAVALVNRTGDHLKAMGVSLPTGQLLDQVLPPTDDLMNQIDFGKLLPDFAGLKLDSLLPELKSPEGLKDKVKVTQSFDKQSGRGWVKADVRVPVDGPSVLFDAGVLQVSLRDILLTAQIRIAAGISGAPTHSQFGKLAATWDLTLGGNPLITFEDTSLSFDESGKTKFNLDPTKVRMNGVLSLLSDLMSTVSTGEDGFILRLKEENGMPVGVEAQLDIPLPDVAFGAFAMTNLRFGVHFELVALPEFAIGLAVNISRKMTPFTITILLLGGGGWFVARGRYLPLSNRLTTAVSLGINAGAMLAVAFGPIKGSVFAFFYVEGELQTDSDNPGSRELIIRIGLLLGGDVDAAGFATVSIRLLLEVEYDGSDGALTGRGKLSVKVKVCFFFTFRFSRTVQKRLAGNKAKNDPNHQKRVQAACDQHLERTAA